MLQPGGTLGAPLNMAWLEPTGLSLRGEPLAPLPYPTPNTAWDRLPFQALRRAMELEQREPRPRTKP